jgi:Response regulator containing a CheY-like receiver domain and an HD-GYP domain
MDSKRETIIIVDDVITNLTVGVNSLDAVYDVFTAPSGPKLFAVLKKVTPDLILLDIEMPEMDGYEVIQILKGSDKTSNIPVIFLTSKIDPISEVKGLDLGAVDYITKPFSRELLLKRVGLHLLLERQKRELLTYSRGLESEVSKKTKAVVELQNAILMTVAELVECRDSVTGGHIERTQRYLGLLINLAFDNGIYTDELKQWNIGLVVMSSQLHDVGKVSIKDDILLKQEKLTHEEFAEIKKHAEIGAAIIRRIESNTSENAFLKHAEVFAESHHEKWDGTGYPNGIKGEEIPLEGRLMAIVDVYDALTNDRPYKKAYTHEEAVNIIRDGRGSHFDPLLCDVFLRNHFTFQLVNLHAPSDVVSYDELRSMVKMVANIMDLRSVSKNGRTDAIQHYLKIFIAALLENERYGDEVSSWDIELLLLSAQLHDVGQMGVNDKILSKSGALTEDEYEAIKLHTEYGMNVMNQIKNSVTNSSMLYHAEVIASSHHEKWDGTGYPNKLKGKAIPLQGRIMTIVDVYEALVNDRPHRTRKAHHEAIEIIKNLSGTHFDPELVTVFVGCEHALERMEAE